VTKLTNDQETPNWNRSSKQNQNRMKSYCSFLKMYVKTVWVSAIVEQNIKVLSSYVYHRLYFTHKHCQRRDLGSEVICALLYRLHVSKVFPVHGNLSQSMVFSAGQKINFSMKYWNSWCSPDEKFKESVKRKVLYWNRE